MRVCGRLVVAYVNDPALLCLLRLLQLMRLA
jgi:hypothetical protein